MRLDYCCIAAAAFDDIRINRTLYEIVHLSDFLCFPFKCTNKFFANDFPLPFWVRYTMQLFHENILCIDPYKMDVPVCKCCFDFIAFILPQESMVNKDTSQLVANCLREQSCCNGAINTARQCQQYLSIANLFPNLFDGSLCIVFHRPITRTSTNLIQEIMQHLLTIYGMIYFRMELYAIELLFRIFHCCYRTAGRMCRNRKAFRQLLNIVGMAHPRDCFFRQTGEQQAFRLIFCQCLAVFSGFFRGSNCSAQRICHQLAAVADAQNRNAQFKNSRVYVRRFWVINAVRPTGKDDANWISCSQFCNRCCIPHDFAVNSTFSDSACNQLIILPAKV
ncbi:putative uncharacterized protein [Ruminococcus sp. CAG:254]|nr:putative uncharacterized protein [Ruminococcus sp. CAG:254]